MLQDLSLSDCEVAAYVNYSIANRFHNTIIGAVGTGFLLNFTNQIDICKIVMLPRFVALSPSR